MKDKIIKILKEELSAMQLVDDSDPIEIVGLEKAATRIDSLYSGVIEYGKADPDRWMEHKNNPGGVSELYKCEECNWIGSRPQDIGCPKCHSEMVYTHHPTPSISEGENIEDVLKRLTKKNGLINTILELLQQNGIDITQALSKAAKPMSEEELWEKHKGKYSVIFNRADFGKFLKELNLYGEKKGAKPISEEAVKKITGKWGMGVHGKEVWHLHHSQSISEILEDFFIWQHKNISRFNELIEPENIVETYIKELNK